MFEQEIQRAARLIHKASHAVALTGAGSSTPSGIPDFRSCDSGMWQHANPMEVASIHGFKSHPQAFYDWMHPLAHTILNAEPNPSHIALARLEQLGYLNAIITQNIDTLHTHAGSTNVYEVHGHLREATCISCFRVYSADTVMGAFLENGAIPRCSHCDGVLKPNVILFGEQLPAQVLFAAQQAARNADLMIVAGSSLEVAPAGDLPLLTARTGGKLIIINYDPTHVDRDADVIIPGDVADVLPRIVETLEALQ